MTHASRALVLSLLVGAMTMPTLAQAGGIGAPDGKPTSAATSATSPPDEEDEAAPPSDTTLRAGETEPRTFNLNEGLWTRGGVLAPCDEACQAGKYQDAAGIIARLAEAMRTPRAAAAPAGLRRIDDFYESRAGVLIHEECFSQYPFDIEEAVSEAVLQGLVCLHRDAQKGDMIYRSHIPRLVNLLSPENWSVEAHPMFGDYGDMRPIRNPCDESNLHRDYRGTVTIHPDCSFVPEVQMGRPKLWCQNEQKYLVDRKKDLDPATTKHFAYASINEGVGFGLINYQGKTKIYNPPQMGLTERPPEHRMPRAHFKATIWHELMHNLGYAHTHENTPDYAYMCEVGCFAEAYGGEVDQDLSDRAFGTCSSEDSSGARTVLSDARFILNRLRDY